ncbi:MAG: hypothetical protein AABX72_04005 [Nanoarchaeota archaeon]
MKRTTVLVMMLALFLLFSISFPKLNILPTGRFIDETGLFVGKFYLNIVSNHYNSTFMITNMTNFTSNFGVSFHFMASQTSTGIFNTSMLASNPFENATIQNAESINKFMHVETINLSFTNVTITMPYSEADIGAVDESTLRIYVYDPLNTEWAVLSGSVNTNTNEVTGTISHFSTFGIFGSTESGGSGGNNGGGSSGSGSSGGGGGRGDGNDDETGFKVSPSSLQADIAADQSQKASFEVENIGDRKQVITINADKIGNLITFEPITFSLNPNEKMKVNSFISALHQQSGIFTGKITMSNNLQKEVIVPTIIHVMGGHSAWKINVRIFDEHKQITAGKRFNTKITLKNDKLKEPTSLKVKYILADYENVVYGTYEEQILFDGDEEFTKVMETLSTLAPGSYLVIVQLLEGKEVMMEQYDTFDIINPPSLEKPSKLTNVRFMEISLPLGLFILLVAFFYIVQRRRRNKGEHHG